MKTLLLSPTGPRRHVRGARGMALVMTIIILALVTLLVMGFADLVRNETISSSAHLDRARSQALAQTGVNFVIGTLRDHTADPDRIWASQPGSILVPAESSSGNDLKKLVRQVPLHSGLPSQASLQLPETDPLRPANLNIETLSDQNPRTHLITDQRTNPDDPASPIVTLPLRWVYMRQDGTLENTETPSLGDTANPIVGRTAWWTDDESSKININTAWKRNPPSGTVAARNPFSPSHVSSVNLTTLPGMTVEMADTLHRRITPEPYDFTVVNRFFNSTREIRALGTEFAPVLNGAKFEVTHYNHDPDTTFFNTPRIVLTTQEKYAPRDASGALAKDENATPYFLDVLKTANTDPGLVSRLDAVKLNKTVLKLISYLEKSDWPVATQGKSIQSKYYNTSTVRLAQLALNIIDYVRSAESTEALVEPIRGIMRNGEFVADFVDGSIRGADDTYKGITRSLFVTEMGTWVSQTKESSGIHSGRFRCKFFVELHLRSNFGVQQVNLTSINSKKLYVYFTPTSTSNGTAEVPGGYYDAATGTPLQGKTFRVDRANIVGGNPVLTEGGYAALTFEAYLQTNTRPTNISSRVALMLATDRGTPAADPGTHRFELSPVGPSVNYRVDSAGTPENMITSLETEDPLMNCVVKDWNAGAQTLNTFGQPNKRLTDTLGVKSYTINPSLGIPEQDTDANGKITDAGMRMPYPKGSARNPEGIVYSQGELGYIHTGVEISSTAARGGIGWRTLRLQPYRHYTRTGEVPDWAFMDLFTVPVALPARVKGIFAPHGGTAGRINLNSQAQPYGDPAQVASPLERRLPIAALLTGVYTHEPTTASPDGLLLGSTTAGQVARNIYFHTLADKGIQYGYPAGYDSPGEVVEIKGVADNGEESESIVRGIANLISTRGGVFTIYTIGQSLQQTRNGKLLITAETRQQTMLERYSEPSTPSEVHFRRVSYQPVTP